MKWVARPQRNVSFPVTSTLLGNTSERSLLGEVTQLIDSAEEVAIICSFLVASPEVGYAVKEAASRGVRVYVLTSAESALNDGKWFLTDSDRALEAKHREALNKLSNFARVRSSPHWHTKFILADPRANPMGLLLSANLNSHALRSSPEIAVPLREGEVRTLFEVARSAYWSATSEIRDGVWSTASLNRIVSQVSGSHDIVCTTADSSAVLSQMRNALRESRSVTLTTYAIDRGSVLVGELRELAEAGAPITIICHPSRNNAASLQELSAAGCRVFGIQWLHAKLLDCGGDDVLMVSQNLDAPTNKPRLETAMVLREERAADARAWLSFWIDSAGWLLQ